MKLLAKLTVVTLLLFAATIQAQTDALFIDATGKVGIGTSTPNEELEIRGSTGGTKFLVVETLAADATLFELRNNGGVKFGLTNTAQGKAWTFTNSGPEFRVTLTGSPVLEARFREGGNLTIGGVLIEGSDRNMKTGIESVSARDILAKVRQLEISKWQYNATKGEDHIGPMAQDFYRLFKLGATDKGIASLDSAGVALASIQALADENEALKTSHKQLLEAYHAQQEELTSLRNQSGVSELETRVARAEALLDLMLKSESIELVNSSK